MRGGGGAPAPPGPRGGGGGGAPPHTTAAGRWRWAAKTAAPRMVLCRSSGVGAESGAGAPTGAAEGWVRRPSLGPRWPGLIGRRAEIAGPGRDWGSRIGPFPFSVSESPPWATRCCCWAVAARFGRSVGTAKVGCPLENSQSLRMKKEGRPPSTVAPPTGPAGPVAHFEPPSATPPSGLQAPSVSAEASAGGPRSRWGTLCRHTRRCQSAVQPDRAAVGVVGLSPRRVLARGVSASGAPPPSSACRAGTVN